MKNKRLLAVILASILAITTPVGVLAEQKKPSDLTVQLEENYKRDGEVSPSAEPTEELKQEAIQEPDVEESVQEEERSEGEEFWDGKESETEENIQENTAQPTVTAAPTPEEETVEDEEAPSLPENMEPPSQPEGNTAQAAAGAATVQNFYYSSTVKFGDINNDGKINSLDSLLVQQHISAVKSANVKKKHPDWILSGSKYTAADVNGDGAVNTTDNLLISRHTAGKNKIITIRYKSYSSTLSGPYIYEPGEANVYSKFPQVSRSGYTLKGWYTSSSGGNKITAHSSVKNYDHTIYTQWTGNSYVVTYDANGGKVSGSGSKESRKQNETCGQPYQLYNYVYRVGYCFDGWYTAKSGGTKVKTSTQVTKAYDHTLYAHWSPAISLDLSGKKTVNGSITRTSGIAKSYKISLKTKSKLLVSTKTSAVDSDNPDGFSPMISVYTMDGKEVKTFYTSYQNELSGDVELEKGEYYLVYGVNRGMFSHIGNTGRYTLTLEAQRMKNDIYALCISGIEGGMGGSTTNDIKLIEDRITNNKSKEYGKKSVETFKYNSEKTGTSQSSFDKAIRSAYEDAGEDDLAIFFYSGHGNAKNGAGVGLTLSPKAYYSYDDLAKRLSDTIKCKNIVVIINACYAGGFYESGILKLSKKDQSRFSSILSSATDETSYSYTVDEKTYSRMGAAIGYGLGYFNGIPYADSLVSDGKITVQELAEYIQIRIIEDTFMDPAFIASDYETMHPEYYASNKDLILYQYDGSYISIPEQLTLYPQDSTQLYASLYNLSGNATWYSGNITIAQVDADGKVTAVNPGTTVISAALNGIAAQCTVTVKKPEIELNYKNLPLQKGKSTSAIKIKTCAPDAQEIKTAKSSNTKIASVKVNKGVLTVTGKKAGKATVTVTSSRGATAKVSIDVKAKVNATKLSLNKKNLSLKKGKTYKLTVTKTPVTATNGITWSSSNKKVATVSSNGTVKGIKKGRTVIKAKASNGKTTTCNVIVY